MESQTLAELTDDDLIAYGHDTLRRGRQYAQIGRVISATASDDGAWATARVLGSGGKIYRVEVDLELSQYGIRLHNSCTCPLGASCKHVVAVIMTLRTRPPWRTVSADDHHSDSRRTTPGWQDILGQLVQAEQYVPEPTPVALHIEASGPTGDRRRWRHTMDEWVRIRPMVPGRRNTPWVKTGISWDSLWDTYEAPTLATEVLSALTAITSAHRQHDRYSRWSRIPDWIDLAALGAGWIDLLINARDAGITLLPDRSGKGAVHLESEPGRFVLDISPTDGEDIRVSPHFQLPAMINDGVHPVITLQDADPGSSQSEHDAPIVIGDPPSGWCLRSGRDLWLGGFGPEVDQAASHVVAHGPVTIPRDDWKGFVTDQLPILRRRATVRTDDSLDVPDDVPPRLHLSVRFAPDHVTVLHWSLSYGPREAPTRVLFSEQDRAIRDASQERRLLAAVPDPDTLPALWEGTGQDRRLAVTASLSSFDTVTFTELLPGLQSDERIEVEVEGEPTAYAEVTESPRIALGTAESDDKRDWFDLQISVTVGGHAVPLGTLVTAIAREDEKLLLSNGAWFSLDQPELHKLRELVEEARSLQDKPSDPLRLSVLHAGLWDELVEIGVVEEQAGRWQQSVDALLGIDSAHTPAPAEVPDALRATLRPYQLDGFRWLSLLWDLGLGGILADDMGLGKTLQVLATALRAKERGELTDPMVIVAPTSVLATWVGEVERFAPDLDVAVLDRTRGKSKVPITEAISGADLVVTTYAVARIDAAEFGSVTWSAAVLDEAQFVKNHQAKTYAAMRRLPARVTFALTGTPLENSLMDLWSLLSIVAPGLHPRPQQFRDEWVRPIEAGEDPELLATLRRRIRPLMLRRTKDTVAADLPPKQEQLLHVALHPRHRTIYDRHLTRERQRLLGLIDDLDGNRIAILRALTVMRQMALDPTLVDQATYGGVAPSAKIETLVEQITELAAEGHRALVFSQFTGFLALVRQRLDDEGIEHAHLDGSTRRRREVVEEFRTGQAPVFLISLKAGGFGLTLTEADYVFVLDPWWNPAAENQAIDRAHRIGQTRSVNVYRLVSTDTIEEKVIALQDKKRNLFDRVVDDGELLSGALTADDLRGLLER
ncbi:SNF2-related protein [Propionibacteriaceae bacterium Y1700]|uniref:DEAD/DEAH box helicase n=1 Tax=Microlunatus sp. Y1700 TaxID=3418487 RepID=UPI003DA6F247